MAATEQAAQQKTQVKKKATLPLFTGPDAPSEEGMYKCVHCGFCLQSCPTYLQTGLETESPRGRIALMKAVNEGRLGITPQVFKHWDMCIQCRACEAVCPSGVPYGSLIEATMAQVEKHRKLPWLKRRMANFVVNNVLMDQAKLTALVGAARLYQQSGLQRLVRATRLLRLGPKGLAEMERSMPYIPQTFFAANGQTVHSFGAARATVALLSGCFMPLFHGPQMRGVARVLSRNGCNVKVPKGQVCCGAIHTHVGDLERSRQLARRNIDIFLESNVDAIVVASAGCGTRMKEYGHLLRDDPAYAEKAERVSAMVKDVHEYLVGLPFVPPQGRLDYKVTYQDSCHLSHTQRVTSQPRALLKSIPGLTFVEMPASTRCCGAGGTYTITQPDASRRLLDRKMADIRETGADVVATANPGCIIQIDYGTRRAGAPLQVKYVTDLLDEAYSKEPRKKASWDAGIDPEFEWEERQDFRAKWEGRGGDRRQRLKRDTKKK
ncbi:MAG: (Fe-S)-binding protein [SAR202 cluster bacterium]|nr:(Fe-S)-binding protein [SAR202 cluster bacterium]